MYKYFAMLFVALALYTGGVRDARCATQPATPATDSLAPYAANLFAGNFAQDGKDAPVSVGDRIIVRLWGGLTFDGTVTVDDKGNIILPDVGDVPVAGLPSTALADALKSKLASLGRQDVQLYVAPLDTRPIAVFVTGGVRSPGRYQGAPNDPVLTFLDKAGGIAPERGSYRHINVLRQGREVAAIDLYPFARQGSLPMPRLQDGDTIVVAPRGVSVSAQGMVRSPARFEFAATPATGRELLSICDPDPSATHVSLRGVRQGKPYTTYLPLQTFGKVTLADGDSCTLVADKPADTIMVTAQGAVKGTSRFPIKRGARLNDIRNFIAVDPQRAQLDALYIKRKSVAARQKSAIADSLRRLEESAMTASSGSTEEAQIRAKEAEMVSKFVERAKSMEPQGVVVLDSPEANPALEDGDVIVIPEKSDVVVVSGEVMMPQAIVWSRGKDIDDYVANAGGYSPRANQDEALIMRQNGAVARNGKVQPGDQILVLPKVETKGMQVVKDMAQVLFQVATSCRFVLGMPVL